MSYAPFYERFPELAAKETRVLTVFSHPDLPPDEYGLLESYCDEQGCDCRRVFFNVASRKHNKILAVIAYGWESKRFYTKWFGKNDPEVINDLQGPVLNMTSHQSKLAPTLLREVKNVVLQDQNYVNRLKRHYQMFKDAVDNEPDEEEIRVTSPKRIARNDPCPCGSGKKYKHCCGR